MTDDTRELLRKIYDDSVDARDRRTTPEWEDVLRDAFVERLGGEGARTVLEVGAATGTDGLFFEQQGFDVVCVDLSPAMVRRCQDKGLSARVMDVSDLRFPDDSFDVVYAKNCLIHVAKAELHETLLGVRRVLRPDGLFYLALYGGTDFEGIFDGDPTTPKRFFSFYTDAHLQEAVARVFEIESAETLPHGWAGLHYQSLVLRNRA